MNEQTIALEEQLERCARSEFESPYMQKLKAFLVERRSRWANGYFPKGAEYFRALNLTPLADVKVVILGQDPYHGAGAGARSLLQRAARRADSAIAGQYLQGDASDLGIAPARHGFLEHWARQGVLAAEQRADRRGGAGCLAPEKGLGDIYRCRDPQGERRMRRRGVHPLGRLCAAQGGLCRYPRHLVLKSPHPSPLSAHNGFFGCHHFSKANAFLESHGRQPIDWQLPADPRAEIGFVNDTSFTVH
jgi:uracil-DNA glycosylase